MSTRAIPAPHVLSVADGEDTVLLDLVRGRYYSLNPAAARLWALLAEGLSVDDAKARVCEEFDAPADAIRADLAAVIESLQREALVRND